MTGRPFTDAERAAIQAACDAFAREYGVQVGHRYTQPDDVWLWITHGGRTAASGVYTALIDRPPFALPAGYAVRVTLERMWTVRP